METKGWITYICKECDEKRKGEVEPDGEGAEEKDEEEPKPDQDVKEEE